MSSSVQDYVNQEIFLGLSSAMDVCHEHAKRWRQDPATGLPLQRNRGEMIALMHSELSELLEGERKPGTMDSHLPHRPNPEVELADLLIRAFDYAKSFGWDLPGAFLEKLEYNHTRADHTHEARLAPGGKKF
jgi:NTP pyrophosphatase (non-canonical NTP hydrolase)